MKGKPRAVKSKPWLAGIFILSTIQFFRNAWTLRILFAGKSEVNAIANDYIIQENIQRLGPIFYNVFIPESDVEKQDISLRIVKEQMAQGIDRWCADLTQVVKKFEIARHGHGKRPH